MTEREPARPESQTSVVSAALPSPPLVALVGNPNVGKTTLFNALSGRNARVGNYPGVTVDRRTELVSLKLPGRGTRTITVQDVPGAYSLSARSAEEQIAINAALGLAGNPTPALVVAVVDAGQLIRNLYLVLQLIELEVPLIVALNMYDEVAHDPPSAEALARELGVPVIATSARTGLGLHELEDVIASTLDAIPRGRIEPDYPPELLADADRVAEHLPGAWRGSRAKNRALALWALSSIDEDDELASVPDELREAVRRVRSEAGERNHDDELIGARYRTLDELAPRLWQDERPREPERSRSDRLDRVLLHPVFGFAIFIAIMFLVFQALFSWADPAIGLIESGVAALQQLAARALPEHVLSELVVEGIIGGVGNVVVFLPQILLLFFFIGLLEDSGYMSRVAYLMDRIMRSVGLHGRAFVPMLSGFACAVPAIMATRTMERQRDRLLTMLVVPLMTCSARLPVYTLIIAALFPPALVLGFLPLRGLMMVAMYLFGTVTALFAAGVLGRTVVKGRRVPLILELPPYRRPRLGNTLRMMWERSRTFLREAGTVILFFTVVLWGLLNFPKQDADAAPSPPVAAASTDAARSTDTEASKKETPIQHSYGGRLGKAIEPALAPLGFDWKIGVGLIGAFAAREVFISTMALVYGVGEVDDEALPLRQRIKQEKRADGRPSYTPLIGLSLMVFFALACQCMSTVAVVKRETRTWRWPAFLFVYMTALAWVASFVVYQGGRLLGFA